MNAPATEAPHAELLARIEAAWRRSDGIFAMVRPEALSDRPIPLRHPLVFYLGHLPAFGWNLLGRAALGRDPLDPRLDELFAFGIDPTEGEAARGEHDVREWPDLGAIEAYRDRARDAIRAAAPAAEEARDPFLAENARVLHLVLEHELMHHETLLYLLQEMAPERKVRPPGWEEPPAGREPPPQRRARVPAGTVRLGADLDEIPFGWDNEFPARRVEVEEFELDALPVTNARYREFVEEGGYESRELWSDRAWEWIGGRETRLPKDWVPNADGSFAVRTMFGAAPLEEAAAWPVCVTHAEAEAYARFRGARLPTEAELRRAALCTPDGGQRAYPWGGAPPAPERGSFDLFVHGPRPVGSHPAGDSAFGVGELAGNGWEWTSTVWEPHEGFRPLVEAYAGYSRDFYDGEHAVVVGGSYATDARLLRPTFRNWYRWNYPYPFTKLRLAAP